MKKSIILAIGLFMLIFAGCSAQSNETANQEEQVQNQQEVATGKVVEITLDSFKFGYSQEEIVVNKGDTIRLTLTNSDGFHDFVIDEFDVATKKINQGETDTIEFTVDKAGEFEYYCSVGNHREMGQVGTLIVNE